jgi:hypothetical protein
LFALPFADDDLPIESPEAILSVIMHAIVSATADAIATIFQWGLPVASPILLLYSKKHHTALLKLYPSMNHYARPGFFNLFCLFFLMPQDQ